MRNPYPHHCGRMDRHEPHEWTRPLFAPGPESFVPARAYVCAGVVTTEGGWRRCPGCGTSGPPHPVGGVECRETAREKAINQGDV